MHDAKKQLDKDVERCVHAAVQDDEDFAVIRDLDDSRVGRGVEVMKGEEKRNVWYMIVAVKH